MQVPAYTIRDASPCWLCRFAQQLDHREGYKKGVIEKISFPQTHGFLPKPIHPCKSQSLHPLGSEGSAACQKLESIANSKKDPSGVTVSVATDPSFLLSATKRHPNEVRIGACYNVREANFVGIVPSAAWWAKRSYDLKPRLQRA